MKVLTVNISIDPIAGGGTAERTLQLSRFLSKKGIDTTILSLGKRPDNIPDVPSSQINILPVLSKRFYIPKGGLGLIRSLVKETDIIHVMNHWSLLNVIVYYYATRFNKPYIVCPGGALPVMGRSKIIKKLFNRVVGNQIIKKADGFIAIAENEFDQYKEYGINKERIHLIPNAVDVSAVTDHHASSLQFPENYILFLGRLNYIKGPDLLLKAFSELPQKYSQYSLVFAGPDSGMLDSLKNMVDELNLKNRVYFFGGVSGGDKRNLFQKCKFLIIPSRCEAMSIVVLEAGVYAKPALITDQCGFNCIRDISGGVVVSATSQGIKEGLISMLDNPLLSQMGKNLKNFILENYTWDIIVGKSIAMFEEILQRRTS